MPWIKVIDESEATDAMAEVYSDFRAKNQWKNVPEGEACMTRQYVLFTTNGKAFQKYVEYV